jgi:hypothetical protein
MKKYCIVVVLYIVIIGVIRPAFGSHTFIVSVPRLLPDQSYSESIGDTCSLSVVSCENKLSETENIIKKYFPENYQVAIAIAKAESGLNPLAIGAINSNGTQDFGLFQINSIHNPSIEQKITIRENVKMARAIYDSRLRYSSDGFEAWSTYNSGRYLHFMP